MVSSLRSVRNFTPCDFTCWFAVLTLTPEILRSPVLETGAGKNPVPGESTCGYTKDPLAVLPLLPEGMTSYSTCFTDHFLGGKKQ